jgi:hypothetical protein
MNFSGSIKLSLKEIKENPEIRVVYRGISRKFTEDILKEMKKLVSWLEFSPICEEKVRPNHYYGYEITQEAQLKQFYDKTEKIKLFFLEKMVVTFDEFWGNYLLQPATAYQSRTERKTIYIISTYNLEIPSRIAKLALHEILESIVGKHCANPCCILHPFQQVPEYFFVENEKKFYENLSKELDKEKGLCKMHEEYLAGFQH